MIATNYYEGYFANTIDKIISVEYFKNGEKFELSSNEEWFEDFKEQLFEIFSNSRSLPSLGVSLHEETKKELKHGEWIQINFKDRMEENGLIYDGLLFRLEQTCGINLIRILDGKYEGRTFYLDLDEEINSK